MEKLVSLMMSAIVLTLSAARSIQAQPFLDFTPNASPSIPKTPIAAQSVRSQPSEEASFSQAETPTAVKSVGLPVEFSTPSNSPPEPTVQSSNVADRAVMAVSDEDDRLVAVLPDDLFEGGSNSLVAKAIGSAEGTRTPDGGKTWAYYGHTDPGNGRWNLGSFSYQHGAASPEEADQRQLDRLWQQFKVIRQSATSVGLRLGLVAQLNGIDLANQAPLAALERGGYVDRLQQAYAQGLRGAEAVLQARTYSYLNPRTNQWDAPGLGNNVDRIGRDQARRQNAIFAAVSIHQQVARSSKLRSSGMKVSHISE